MKLKLKNLVLLFLFTFMLIFPCSVFASEVYFKNQNGVELTLEEYNFLVKKFWNGFPSVMTKEDYFNLINDESVKRDIKTIYISNILPINEGIHKTGSKSLKVSSACSSSFCDVSVVLEWLVVPNVKSYDIIGAYLDGTQLLTNPVTRIVNDGALTSSNEIIKDKNGFGVSVKLPSDANNLFIYQYYKVSLDGTIYQSYQHAISNITLKNSKKYSISRGGFGGVFLFDESIRDKYDGMGGVKLEV